MKQKFVLALMTCFLMAGVTLQAQNVKIGYADVDYILSEMPETKQVESELQSLNTQLQNQLQAKYQEYQQKLQAYQQGASTMVDAIRQEKETELAQLEQRIQKLQQDAQSTIQKKTSDLMQPLYVKIGDSIEAVAKANGYTYVLNGQVGGIDVVLYADEQYDVSDLVLKNMGITPSTPAE
ncbi:OmpH family outer membrane protein [Fulvivirga sedimenti]|uniref:OmpH family outer membrane protein n=1 Tax=Fulvivirga sedimenti TaxID=2879465 RepID=A0A9X1KWY2_9BACT|nr:OmpH family outer membrane protein [Fulvivirga sedimenti]MCA6074419.1 OmpH family outer membrane protein [Fulvivirga sedimenti]